MGADGGSLPNNATVVAAAAAAAAAAVAGALCVYYYGSSASGGRGRPWRYPAAARTDATVDRHGVSVPDCYAWLEDPTAGRTKRWIAQQQALTDAYLAGAGAAGGPLDRARMVAVLKDMKDYARTGCPFFVEDEDGGGRYYYFYNSGLQNQSVLYQCARGASWKSVRAFVGGARAGCRERRGEAEAEEEQGAGGADAPQPPRAFLDMNAASETGTVALRTLSFSKDGRLCAYGVSSSGSDWMSILVRRCDGDRGDLEDVVRWSKFSGISWTHDSAGFFYSSMPKPASLDAARGDDAAGTEVDVNTGHSVFYHRIGTDYRDDVLVHRDAGNPNHLHGCGVSECGRYAVLSTSSSCDPTNMVAVSNIVGWDGATPLHFHALVPDFRASFHYVHNDNRTFYFKTNLDAPRNKVRPRAQSLTRSVTRPPARSLARPTRPGTRWSKWRCRTCPRPSPRAAARARPAGCAGSSRTPCGG